jgi:hypothetical protein
MGNRPVHGVIADDYAVPTATDQIVPGQDLSGCPVERNKHLHHSRLDGPALRTDGQLACRGVNYARPKPKRRLVRKNDAHGLSSAIHE